MPDERRRRKADLPAARLQSPAHIHIVACAEIDGIETTDGEEGVAPERHVAAGDVFGDAVVEQHVGGAARGAGNALRGRRIVGRNHVGTTSAGDVRRQEGLHEEGEPVAVDASIGVGVGDDRAGGSGQPDVARRAQPAVRDVDDLHRRMCVADLAGAVARPVVHEEDLDVRVGERLE